MKKLHICFLVSLFLTAALLVACFAALLSVNALVGGGDLAQGLATVFTLILTLIPVICFLPVALALVIIAICLIAVKKKGGSAVAALVILSVFLPALVYALCVIAVGLASSSAVYAVLVALCGIAYLSAFGLSIAYVVAVHRERAQIPGENV